MKLTSILWLIGAAGVLSGCYNKHLVLQSDVVSMTQTDAGSVKSLRVGPEVEEKWCMGDELALPSQGDQVGLADQVIYKAQDGGKRADFITDVRIYRDTDGCALLSGKTAKL